MEGHPTGPDFRIICLRPHLLNPDARSFRFPSVVKLTNGVFAKIQLPTWPSFLPIRQKTGRTRRLFVRENCSPLAQSVRTNLASFLAETDPPVLGAEVLASFYEAGWARLGGVKKIGERLVKKSRNEESWCNIESHRREIINENKNRKRRIGRNGSSGRCLLGNSYPARAEQF